MATAGYSGKPIFEKLGIKDSMKIMLVNTPSFYSEMIGYDIQKQLCKSPAIPDLIHLFTASTADYEKQLQKLKVLIEKNPKIILWVSWYKKSSGKNSDLTETHIRNYALANGLVDIKVCAVSEEWSGLKLVVPLAKR